MLEQPKTDKLGSIDGLTVPATRKACLLVVFGPEKGALFPLLPGTFQLGRSADKVVNGRGVSRRHAEIEVTEQGRVRLRDLNSTNGVFVNGAKIDEVELHDGDQIGLGPEVLLKLEYPDAAVKQLMEDLYRGATLDPLTGILNRKSFMERAEQEHAATRRHGLQNCIAILDIDHFKSVNDTHGHPAGDAVIRGLADILTEQIRSEDAVGRFGGEEFVLLIRYSDLHGARVMLERIRAAVERHPFVVPTPEGSKTIEVTISLGVCPLACGDSAQASLAVADEALYEAKSGGRNRVVTRQ